MNLDDRELRERCLNLAADVFKSPSFTAQQLTTVAEHFFQYIKFGPDDECGCCSEPDDYGPVNTGPGMAVLRDVSNTRAALRRGEIFPS